MYKTIEIIKNISFKTDFGLVVSKIYSVYEEEDFIETFIKDIYRVYIKDNYVVFVYENRDEFYTDDKDIYKVVKNNNNCFKGLFNLIELANHINDNSYSKF